MTSPTPAYAAVLLDLDGTLTDSALGIRRSAQHAMRELGLPELEEDQLRRWIGPPLEEAMLACGVPGDRVEAGVRAYRARYAEVGLFENEVYDGVPELLEALRAAGIRLAVATSKPEVFAERILERFGLRHHLEHVSGAQLDGGRRHKVDVVTDALRRLGLLPDPEVVHVGDRAHDVLGAREAGLRCVGVRWGYAAEGELEAAGADAYAASPSELGVLLGAAPGSARCVPLSIGSAKGRIVPISARGRTRRSTATAPGAAPPQPSPGAASAVAGCKPQP